MSPAWIEQSNGERIELARGVTRVGGPRAQVAVPESGDAELQLWDDPPKLIYVGAGARPSINGTTADECELHDGDRIRWLGGEWIFRAGEVRARLEAIAESSVADEQRVARRALAALAVELDVVDAAKLARWRAAATSGGFDADRCAEDLLSSSHAQLASRQAQERSSKALRDALAPPVRAKRPRVAVESTSSSPFGLFGMFFVQLVLLLSAAAVVLAVAAVIRSRWGVSLDEWIDRALARLGFGH